MKRVDDFFPKGFIIRVLLPQAPHEFVREILVAGRGDVPISEEHFGNPGTNEHAWEIKRPRFGCRYRITWQDRVGKDALEQAA